MPKFKPPDISDILTERLREELLKSGVDPAKVDDAVIELEAIAEKYAKEIREQRES